MNTIVATFISKGRKVQIIQKIIFNKNREFVDMIYVIKVDGKLRKGFHENLTQARIFVRDNYKGLEVLI